jgi:arginyl-tRNA synthetase
VFIELRGEVEDALTGALSALDLPTDDLGVEEPPEDVAAVLASSVAFRLAGEVGAPPPSVAADVAGEIDTAGYDYLDRVDTQGPYVNFHPTERYLTDTVETAVADDWGRLPDRGESVVVEHTSANPTGPVHVGRARNPIVGDALARVLAFAGYDVDTHYYVNDAGRQVAILTWACETFDDEDLPAPEREKADYDLVRYYRAGNDFLDSADPDARERAEAEITAIMQGLEEGEEDTLARVESVVDPMLDGMGETLGRLPATFDRWVHETEFMPERTRAVIDRLRDLDVAVYEDDAWQLDLEDQGIEKKLVFQRSDGTSLYPTRDIAHHEWKLENYDRAVTVLGEDHRLQADQVRTALELLGTDTEPIDQVLYSYVNLPDGKMSTREGTGVDLDDLLDEAVDRAEAEVRDRMGERIREDDLTEADVERIARQVGVGAVRFDIVAKQPTKAITFEWERALNFEAQSAPYVQYVHARCCGIMDRAHGDGTDASGPASVETDALTEPEERTLVRTIARFPAVVEAAAADHQPHVVATYAREFAEDFNGFYRSCPVLSADEEVREARLALVAAARETVGNALSLLGVEAPESM